MEDVKKNKMIKECYIKNNLGMRGSQKPRKCLG